jgi:hypothetical protein
MKRSEIRIGTPCTRDWQSMTPREGGRFCGDCRKVVRDLSKMTERDARALLESAGGGELCVRYIYDQQGRVFFQDTVREMGLVPPSFLARFSRTRRAAATLAITALPFATEACMGAMDEPAADVSGSDRTIAHPTVAPSLVDPDGGVQPDASEAPNEGADSDGGTQGDAGEPKH